MAPRTALVAGAGGLVGGHLLDRLLAHRAYSLVTALVRRELPRTHPKLVQRTIDFEALHSLSLPSVDDIFCTLGTTIRVAGSREAFRAVDLTYVHELARAGVRCGARRFVVVSALGADRSSAVFYNRVKGEMEQAVSGEAFEAVHILRPSIIAGERHDPRAGERIALGVMRALAFAMVGPLRRYRPIDADAIAAAMIVAALSASTGVSVYESETIASMAQERPST